MNSFSQTKQQYLISKEALTDVPTLSTPNSTVDLAANLEVPEDKEIPPPTPPKDERYLEKSSKGLESSGSPASPRSAGSNVLQVGEDEQDVYRHLPPHEAEILKRQVDIPVVKSSWKILYRFATRNDWIIIVISGVCAIAAGAALPLMTVVFGQLAGQFQDFFLGVSSRAQFENTITHMVLYFVYIGIAEFIAIYISTVGFIYTGEHVSGKIRAKYLEAILRQNIGFFDKLGSGEITTRITADTNLVQDGISEKVSLTLNAIATFITAFVVSYVKSWKLTVILTSTVLAITLAMGGGSSFIVKTSKQSLEAYGLGGSVAEEVISSIRNATAFGTQDKLAREYDKHLTQAEKYGYKQKKVLAIMVGLMFMIIFLNYGLAFWMGSRFLVDGEIKLSSILTILMSIMMGAFSLGNIAPNVQAFTSSISAAAKIFNTIDRVSPLDPSSDEGEDSRGCQRDRRVETHQAHISFKTRSYSHGRCQPCDSGRENDCSGRCFRIRQEYHSGLGRTLL